MSSITNLFRGSSDIDKLRNNGYGAADFDVSAVPLNYHTENGNVRTSNKITVYRTDLGDELGVHGKNYSVVSHKSMIDTARNTLERSPLNLNNISEDIEVSHNGAMCYVRHNLPEHKYDTPSGDTATLSMLHLTSLNGVWSYLASFGANQGACLNHQIFVSGAVTVYKARHTKNLDINHSARILGTAIETFENEIELWHEWSDERLDTLPAFKLFAEVAKSKYVEGYLKENPEATVTELMTLPRVYNNNSLMYLWDRWAKHYSGTMGRNYWAAYNTITDWSTHAPAIREKSQDNIAYISHQRADRGREVIKTNFPYIKAA